VALRAPYTTLSPEFDAFLFAPIGVEGNGMSLSVMSALTRLNIDPWREAARLSQLSKEKAVEALSPIIARVPVGGWTALEIPAIALRLVDFLPRHDVVIQSVATLSVSRTAQFRAIYLIAMVLLAVLYFGFIARHQAPAAGDGAATTTSDVPR
jgi:hypothetical protein